MESQNNNNFEEPAGASTGKEFEEAFDFSPLLIKGAVSSISPDLSPAQVLVVSPNPSQPSTSYAIDLDESNISKEDHAKSAKVRVDPILDLWLVDEELSGRFTISTWDSDQAIIFKIKTSSPYNSWVRPVYGLMKPNVSASIQVKCESEKVSLRRLGMDEFSVQVAPVPLASAVMTSDLYTSAVSPNLPELLNIWEKIESLKTSVETHRVLCRVQGKLAKTCVITMNEKSGGNSCTKVCSPQNLEMECYLARELSNPGDYRDKDSSLNLPSQQEQHCCGAVRRLQYLSLSLAILLGLSLTHILYHHNMDDIRWWR
ncbi:hypothetical protein Ocin01_10861 [Orchesella cincta]|uniref:MSP domain-containing protein n=1 Tax=Orchesella cincta TaxID=48709 RepID=A0A1D2MSF8_ORCCI|nr:hypothetical protein Ocin01_10861 [Orchesella cincta]